MHDVAEDAADKDIKVSDVFVPTAGDYAGQAAILEDDATTGGGVFITTNPDGTGTSDVISEIIEGCGEAPPDNNPPNCDTATSSFSVLWPPNHKLKEVSIADVSDPDADLVTVIITGVTQDEPTNGLGDGDKSPDAVLGDPDNTVKVRAERSGIGDGRVYHISFEASDDKGATCSGILVLPVVPHDQGFGNTPIDSRPPEYDSTTP